MCNGRRLLTLVAVGLGAVLVAGCGSDGASAGGGAAGTRTVAAFYPLGWVAEEVGAGRGDVELLTSPGGEPHDLELTPRQIATVSDADLVLLEGGFQPAVDDAVAQGADGTVVDAADVVGLHPATDGEDGLDPHFWLDPVRMAKLAEQAGAAYAEVDPGHAGVYTRAADDLVARLDRLDRDYRAALADCRTRTIVTSHDAFGYLGARYDLTVLPIAGIDPGTEPSPARLSELADLVETKQVTTVFTETLVSPAVAETLADEAGLQVSTLDPIEGLSDDTADEDYLSLMRANLAALVRAGGC